MAPPQPKPWGTCQRDGKAAELYTLAGGALRVCSYGATLVGLDVPDRDGRLDDVLLGFDSLEAYERHGTYVGCAIGRVCSRIARASFTLGGETYSLPPNNGAACHHGGPIGFNSYTWEVAEVQESSIRLRHTSPDLDQGFPGRLVVEAVYSLLETGDGSTALSIRFKAETDKPTVTNLTNHLYFNLAGHGAAMRESMYGHRVTIAADTFAPTDEEGTPLGRLDSVEGTPVDFRTPTEIGARIDDSTLKAGYDHNMALRDTPGFVPKSRGGTRALGIEMGADGRWSRVRQPDAVAEEPTTGRRVEMFTMEPAVHFYTADYLGNDPVGKGGVEIVKRAGFCFETQHFTDSPNQPSFPSVVLEPGQVWETETVFWFPAPRA